MQIQWFPGHMAKARREVQEKLKLVDFVIELIDARAPISSENPMLKQVLQNKPRLIVMMKKDLADQKITSQWLEYFGANNKVVAVDIHNKTDIKKIIQFAKELGKEKIEKLNKRGILPRPARAMIVGVPNVGKSTLINQLINKKAAKTGDRPGITKQQLWIKVGNDFELLDTPGILWPKFETEKIAYHIATIGSIKDQLLPLQDIVAYVIRYLQQYYPILLEERFNIHPNTEDMNEIFFDIGKKIGALDAGGEINYEKVSNAFMNDFRTGRIGEISLDRPSDLM